jgi:CMP-N-acetylneuraminic acid synthetase
MKSVSVVINARLGSTRVKDKLMRPFSDSCLIEIALEKIDEMDFFDNRYLAAAELPLMVLVEKYQNIQVLKRLPESVKPGVNPQSVTFAHYLEVPSDYIFVFNPCLPMITVETIKGAYDYFQTTNHVSYTSSIDTHDWVFDSNGNALTNKNPANLTTNQGETYSKAAHAFHILSKKNLKETGQHWTFSKNDPHLIPIPREQTIDVDDILDFQFAEHYFINQKRGE